MALALQGSRFLLSGGGFPLDDWDLGWVNRPKPTKTIRQVYGIFIMEMSHGFHVLA